MTAMDLKKVSIPLMALVVPLTAFGGWWATHQTTAITQLEEDVRTNRDRLAEQQLEVNTAIGSLNTRHAVMAQNIDSIRNTLERLEKKIDEKIDQQ